MLLARARHVRLLVALCFAAAASGVQAQGLRPTGVFVQGGSGENDVQAASVGLLWPWRWRKAFAGGEVTAQTELIASRWLASDLGGGHQTFTQLALVPLFRWRGAGGQSPWFLEAGIGLSVTDERFITPHKTFGSNFNFSDNLALGRIYGDRGQHELSLRWQHTSNAGLRQPNPGLDLVLVRYTARF